MWSTLIIKFLTASVIHASVYQQRVEIVKDVKKEENCDSDLFCTNSLSLHLGRIKMSLSKLKFKGRVIWTEKCGLTFTFYIGYHNFVHSKLTEAVRSRCQLIEKIERKKLAFLEKKLIKKKLNGNFDLSKSFLPCIFVKTGTLKKRLWVCVLFCNDGCYLLS